MSNDLTVTREEIRALRWAIKRAAENSCYLLACVEAS